MNGQKDITIILQELEERLLDPVVRGSPGHVENLLAKSFVEFGSSGRIYDRKTAIDELQKEPGFSGARTIIDFTVRQLEQKIALVTYKISETKTLRSSIWQFENNQWKMIFHQGTQSALDQVKFSIP